MKLTASNRIQQAERDSLSAQLLTAMEGTAQWERKEAALEVQLVEVIYDTALYCTACLSNTNMKVKQLESKVT